MCVEGKAGCRFADTKSGAEVLRWPGQGAEAAAEPPSPQLAASRGGRPARLRCPSAGSHGAGTPQPLEAFSFVLQACVPGTGSWLGKGGRSLIGVRPAAPVGALQGDSWWWLSLGLEGRQVAMSWQRAARGQLKIEREANGL